MSQEDQLFYSNDDDETEKQYWARNEDTKIRLRKTNQIIIEQSKDTVLQQIAGKTPS